MRLLRLRNGMPHRNCITLSPGFYDNDYEFVIDYFIVIRPNGPTSYSAYYYSPEIVLRFQSLGALSICPSISSSSLSESVTTGVLRDPSCSRHFYMEEGLRFFYCFSIISHFDCN